MMFSLRPFVLVFVVLTLAACRDVVPSSDAGDSWESVQAREAGRIVVLYVPAEGFAYTDLEGEPTGVTVDLMRKFGEWLGEAEGVDVQIDFHSENDWQRFYQRVRNGRDGLFGLGNVTITEARREEIGFSPAYMTNTAVLISPDTVTELTDWAAMSETFDGMSALAFEGTLHEKRLRDLVEHHHPGAEMEFAHSNAEIIDRVGEGGFFAYVDGYNVWRAQERGAPVRHHAIGDDASESFGVIMPLESDWDEPMERFMSEFVGSSAHRAIFERHLGERLAALVLTD